MAGKKLTIADMDARAEALEECADHLETHWTDDAKEREAGNWVATRLRIESSRWRLRAAFDRDKATRTARGLGSAIARAGDY